MAPSSGPYFRSSLVIAADLFPERYIVPKGHPLRFEISRPYLTLEIDKSICGQKGFAASFAAS
jgi:hypothetical protein